MPEKAKLEGKSKGKDKTEGQSVSAQPSRSQSTSQGQPPPAAGVPGDGAAPADDVHDPAQALAVNGAADVNWVDIQKHFGPLHMQRIGVGFAEDKDGGRINAAISAALAVGPLQVALSGLGVHYKLKTKDLKFVLAGLGVDFKRGPLEMGGAFLRLEHDEFAGKIAIHASKFKLNAVGSYGVHGGSPSLFLYAFLDMPLGGPPFFFVEGLAFAFGLNRRLTMPPIGAVSKFPLVADAMGGRADDRLKKDELDADLLEGLTEELTRLSGYIQPHVGEYFVGAGVKFNTFKQVDSFALLAVAFGVHFELDIIGLSTLKVPNQPPNVPPVALIELELLARFAPEEGFLSVQAQLSAQSYILSKSCHLQGGFAFYSWFSGEHGGDFVISIGGYHPKYKIPKHYPTVPRIGFNWQIDEHAHLKSLGYFALTSSAIMAGGGLDFTYQTSNLKA